MTNPSQATEYVRITPDSIRWRASLVFVVCLTLTGLGVFEAIGRSRGYEPVYPIAEDVWTARWLELDNLPSDHTVIIGTSRTKFGIRLNEWEDTTGERPLSLGYPGAHIQPVLHELAERDDFAGLVVCGVTPTYLFNSNDIEWAQPIYKIMKSKDIHRISLSFYLSKWAREFLLENFRCVTPSAFSPIELLRRNIRLKDREGILKPWLPPYFARQDRELQSEYAVGMLEDHEGMAEMIDILDDDPGVIQFYGIADMDEFIKDIKPDIDRIRERGGDVVFIRHPSSKYYYEFESSDMPREKFYDRLINETDSFGIHFEDYPELSAFELPDGSHLRPEDAVVYTKHILRILEENGISLSPSQN